LTTHNTNNQKEPHGVLSSPPPPAGGALEVFAREFVDFIFRNIATFRLGCDAKAPCCRLSAPLPLLPVQGAERQHERRGKLMRVLPFFVLSLDRRVGADYAGRWESGNALCGRRGGKKHDGAKMDGM